MNRVDLASPTPRDIELLHSRFAYPIEDKLYLPVPTPLPDTSLSQVLASRRSRRDFKPVSRDDLNALLWHSARAIEVSPPNRYRWQHRPAPSAGGRHPIDLLIFNKENKIVVVQLYDPVSHALARLRSKNNEGWSAFFDSVDAVLPVQEATIVWFVAHFERTLSKYINGESLVWRDAGALLTTISLVAECLHLNCCALGITGEPLISRVLDSHQKAVGVGGLLVGQR